MMGGIVDSCLSILILLLLNLTCGSNSRTSFLWMCDNSKGLCEKSDSPLTNFKARNSQYTSYKVCRITCGEYASLWPKPSISTQLSKTLVSFHPSEVTVETDITDKEYLNHLKKVKRMFLSSIHRECGNCSMRNSNKVVINVSSQQVSTDLFLGVDESYTITINKNDNEIRVRILSKTIYGVRHGLETLSQLMVSNKLTPNQPDNNYMLVTVDNATIVDRPMYSHRGLLLDTARNYLSIKSIKRQIDAMAHSKLNVLHWHATDTQSFPLKLPSVSIMASYGAYSEKKVYTQEDIADLLQYAKYRGIRIILEVDAPSHSGNGWQWGPQADLGELAVCVNKQPWRSYCIQPPCGQLNPANENVYTTLGQLYGDIIKIYPENEMFHMGGDEVFFPCWNSSTDIINYLKDAGKGVSTADYLWLWGQFQEKATQMYDSKAGNSKSNIILWSSALTDPTVIETYLNKDRYIVQTWVKNEDDLPLQLLNLGYRLIMSTKNAWYLDHGFWGSTAYYPWRTVYKNEISRHKNVLGGEVCMWAEYVDENSIDSRIWPRAAAAAERLWSDPEDSAAVAEPRFYEHRRRLIDRGIKAEALAPMWCIQNEGQCL